MTQQIINVGTGPDSYTGESLRTAFQKVNDNFSQLYAGNVGANISGNIITANGFVTSGNIVAGNVTVVGIINVQKLTASGNVIIGNTYVPSTNVSVGTLGHITFDTEYVYVCVATNTWKRANLSTW